MHQTIVNVVRTILIQASLPSQFWVEALLVSVYVLNKITRASIYFRTPHELLHQESLNIQGLRVFGCARYPHISASSLSIFFLFSPFFYPNLHHYNQQL